MREITITRVVMVAQTSRSCRPLRFTQISWSWLSHDLPQPYARHWQGDLPISPTPTVRAFANEPRVSSSGNVYFEPTLLGLHALSRAAFHSRASAGLGSFPALRCRWFFDLSHLSRYPLFFTLARLGAILAYCFSRGRQHYHHGQP